jgi:multicomponent Na+:H+ antiporter subunit E
VSSDVLPQRHWRRPRVLPVAVLTVVWLLLWSDLSWGNVIAGLLLGVIIRRPHPFRRSAAE